MANSELVTLDPLLDARLNMLGAQAFDGIRPPEMGANFDTASLGKVGTNFDHAGWHLGGNDFG